MTKEELAWQLDGCKIGKEVTKEQAAEARRADLVIVFAANYYLVKLRGALDDEMSAYPAKAFRVDAEGVLPSWEAVPHGDIEACRNWFRREPGCKEIKPIWDEGCIAWSYETEIPHETFRVMDDGEVYCIGIVFSLADLTP